MFITFEGQDGCGKTSQSRMLFEYLGSKDIPVLHTREPGGSAGAEDIRALILSGSTDRWSAKTELLLFMAARSDHIEKTIRPALEDGKVVICDRFVDSTRAYQGISRDALLDEVELLHRRMIGLDPDLTFILDIDPKTALDRSLQRQFDQKMDESRFERMGISFQEKLRSAYCDIANQYPDRCRIVNANRGLEEIRFDIVAHFETLYEKWFSSFEDRLPEP